MSRTKNILLALAGGAACAIGAGITYQFIGLRRDRRLFPRPGKLVKSGNQRLHLHENGSGAPAVVFESGIAASSLSWRLVQPEVAQFARVVSYDRAGLGWSESASARVSLRAMVEDLRAALTAIELPRPFILCGHSFGGLLVRAYAAWYPEEIAGLVLIDPVFPSDWIEMAPKQKRLLATGVKLSRRGALLARIGLVRLALSMLSSGARRIPQWIATASGGKGSGVAARLVNEVRKLPPELWPVIQAQWSDPKSFEGMARHLTILPASAKQMLSLPIPANIPITTLSAANASLAQKSEWDRLGKHIRADDAGHWIQFDKPQLVTEVIREMVLAVQSALGEMQTMKAVRLHGYGDVDQLIYEDVPKPVPAADEILIKMASASVNPVDWKIREGAMQKMMPMNLPAILGRDAAGEVEAIGASVTAFKAGDQVLGLVTHGYAEYVADKATAFALLPEGLDAADAGVLPLVVLTGSQLIENGNWIKSGQTVLITGALGSVGRTAVYVAKQHGAHVIAAVRAKQKKEAEELGADRVIALDDERDLSELKDLDAIADTVGGDVVGTLIPKLKKGGVLASVLGKPPAAEGADLHFEAVWAHPDPARLQQLAADVAARKLAIPIRSRFSLSQIREAHLAGTKGGGKILLTP